MVRIASRTEHAPRYKLPDVTSSIHIPIKQFLQFETCPADWRHFDLYLFRDEQVVFYVGQSHLAFGRVWQHIYDAFKGRSVVGRFILINWPASMNFSIELLSSQDEYFAGVNHNLNAAERLLIEQQAPCFNDAANPRPSTLPAHYAPITAKPIYSRSLKKLIHEAARSLRAEEQKRLNAQGWS
jgi:hypothetical protein